MGFPQPAAIRIGWLLSDQDLVVQQDLYPIDVGKLLWQKRLARKTIKQWRYYVEQSNKCKLIDRIKYQLMQMVQMGLEDEARAIMATWLESVRDRL